LYDLKDEKKTYTYFVLMLLSQALLKGWQPRTVDEAIKHWVANPRGKTLGE